MKKIVCCLSLVLLIGGCSNPELSLSKEELKQVAKHTGRDTVYPAEEWLHNSIRNIEFDIARKLVLQGADVNAEDAEGKTPLYYFGETQINPDDYASASRHIGEFLIEHGADINHRDHNGNTPLHNTVENSQIEKLLIAKGADVNAKNNEGITPLHLAAYDFRFDRYDRPTKNIKILLDAKADVNAQDNNGQTPLHYSVKSDDYNTAYMLVQYGADINIANNQGNTPFAMACKDYRFDLMCLLSDTKGSEKVDFLNFFKAINHDDISYIKNINKKDIDAFIKRYAISPLILATMLNKVKVAKFLIARGADTTIVCDLPKDYQFLGENNVSVEAYALYKWTPLHIAINKCWEANYLEMVKLLASERTVNIKDEDGHSPLSMAKPNSDVSKILIAKGARP